MGEYFDGQLYDAQAGLAVEGLTYGGAIWDAFLSENSDIAIASGQYVYIHGRLQIPGTYR